MEKAYELKGLTDKMKEKGLDVAEDAALAVFESVTEWLEESAAMSETKIDDLLMAALGMAKSYVKDQIDKIDGVDDIP